MVLSRIWLCCCSMTLLFACTERLDPGPDDFAQYQLAGAWQLVAPEFAAGETQLGVSRDMVLPQVLPGGVMVSWSVSSNIWVTATGRVTPPVTGESNGQCVLTATLTCGGLSTNRSFTLTIVPGGAGRDGDPDPRDPGLILVKSADDGFWMGHVDVAGASPTNYVHFTYDFYLAKTQVTWDEYLLYLAENPQDPDPRYNISGTESWITNSTQHPVLHVSWFDAIRYCNWKSRMAGLPVAYRIQGFGQVVTNVELLNTAGEPTTNIAEVAGYRLPTEAEWEYAARAKGATPANQLSGAATGNAGYVSPGMYSVAVGILRPNALGLYDMSGNGGEWCLDKYSTYLSGAVTNRLVWPRPLVYNTDRVMRSGLISTATYLVTGYRWGMFQGANRYANNLITYSFRIARGQMP